MRWIVAMQSKIKVSEDGSAEDAIPLWGESEEISPSIVRCEAFFEPGDKVGTVWSIAAVEHADEDVLVGLAEKARRLFTPDTDQNPDVFGLVASLVGEERGMCLLNGYRASVNHGEGTSCAPGIF